LPIRKRHERGGEFPFLENDGKKVHWSLGNTHFVYNLDKAEAFDDSVKIAKRAEEKRKADSLEKIKTDTLQKKIQPDSSSKKTDELAKKEEPKFRADEKEIKIYFQKDYPQGSVLLKGARIITMKGNEVIEKGDILITNNRISAVGRSGSLKIPANTKVIESSGKTITPGFIDVHSHMWPQWGITKHQVWIYAGILA